MITTDFYDICETGVITCLQETTAFNWKDKVKQVTKATDVYLKSGYEKNIITYPGAFPRVFRGTDSHTVQWEILIDVLVRWNKTEDKAWQDFRAFRSLVFNLFNISYEGRRLSHYEAGVLVQTPSILEDVVLNANDRPRYIPMRDDPDTDVVSHIGQVMALTVTQSINKEN